MVVRRADLNHIHPDDVGNEVDDGLVRLIGLGVPEHRKRPSWHRMAGTPGLHIDLGRLLEFDGREALGVADTLVSP
jgi:hypothetical protein